MIKKMFFQRYIKAGFCLWMLLLALVVTGCVKEPASNKPSEPLSVVALIPAAADNLFWQGVVDVMQAASTSLGLSLDVVYDVNTDRLLPTMHTLLADYTKPDALIFTYQPGVTLEALALAESYRLPSLLINTGLEGQALVEARQRFTYWIGQITPPDKTIGEAMAQALIANAQKNNKPLAMLAVSGGIADKAAVDRNQGLMSALEATPEALLALYASNWSAADAERLLLAGLETFPQASVIWTASGLMIPGVLSALEQAGRRAGEDTAVVTLGWTEAGLDALAEGKVIADVGGMYSKGVGRW